MNLDGPQEGLTGPVAVSEGSGPTAAPKCHVRTRGVLTTGPEQAGTI